MARGGGRPTQVQRDENVLSGPLEPLTDGLMGCTWVQICVGSFVLLMAGSQVGEVRYLSSSSGWGAWVNVTRIGLLAEPARPFIYRDDGRYRLMNLDQARRAVEEAICAEAIEKKLADMKDASG